MAIAHAFGPAAAVSCLVFGSVAMACAANRVPLSAPTGSGQVSAAAVTEIAMERRCSGCDRELEIVLKRDTTAAKTMFGNARRGTIDRRFEAAVSPATFDDLARAVVSEKFFDLLDVYGVPAVADGEWVKTTVTAGARRKTVIDRDGKAPSGLRGLESRIEELATALPWKEKR